MKIVLSIFLGIAVIGCILLGVGLAAANSSLNDSKALLETAQTGLLNAQEEVRNIQTELTDIQAIMQDTQTKLSETESELEKTKSDLMVMTSRAEATSVQTANWYDDYSYLREQINQKLGKTTDSELFITPDSPIIEAKAKEIAGEYSQDWHWNDYQRLYQWVVDNIEYSYDTALPLLPETPDGNLEWMPEYWKLPAETLKDETGDCEDMAGLLASLIMSYNDENYAVWAIVIRDNDGYGHVAVALPVINDQLAIFDPAGNYYSGQYSDSVQTYDIYEAVGDWLAHWAPEMPGAKITEAFSDDFHQDFTGTQDFIQWAIDKYAD